MSDSQQLLSVSPNGIRGFLVEIETTDGKLFDISGTILEMSMYESIYFPYIHGELSVVDNSRMFSEFPFIGQEKLRVQWERDEEFTVREFFITKVADIARNRDGYGVYELTITSEVQMRNSTSLFSRSYKGRGDEIISGVYSDFLNTNLIVGIEAKTSHSVVFPYMKPLQAADMIRKNVLAADDTPMFVYDSLYPNEVRLESFGSMFAKEPITTIEQKKPTNTSQDGVATDEKLNERGTVYDTAISRAYNTFDQVNKGAYASYVNIVDPSTREYQKAEFDFKKDAPTISGEWITDNFTIGGENVNEIYDTKNYYLHRNKYAFNFDPPNLSSIEDLDLSILNSYLHRHANTLVKVYMDSIAYTLDTNEAFGVGKTVNYNITHFSPSLNNDKDLIDEVNSGKYIVASLRHYIRNGEYTMSAELIRDGIGENANLDRLFNNSSRSKESNPSPITGGFSTS
jgi:hypothetical protein